MKIKNVKLEWKVLNFDFNRDEIIDFNVFYPSLIEDIASNIKTGKIKHFDELKQYLLKEFRYHYWARTECEILVGGIHTAKAPTKIDIFHQLEMNIDRIAEYVINEMKIDFSKKKEV